MEARFRERFTMSRFSDVTTDRADAHLVVGVLVIGAGPTGIGAALRLQAERTDWLLVEATDRPGGMASSVTDEHGFTWDLGGHVLHSHFPDFDKAIAASGVELLSPTRNGWVWMDGELLPAPVQHQVPVLPTDLDPDGPAENLADFYRNHLGADLYARFFEPFTEKMWAAPLEQIDHQWTSLRNGSAARNVPTIRLKADAEPTAAVTFPYPAGGTGALWDGIAAALDQDRIRYGARVVAIDLASRTARLDNGDSITFTHCISSMPLTTLVQSVARPELAELAPSLISNESLVIGLGFDGPAPEALRDKSWLYCPDRQVAWHRATMLGHYDPANAGPGRWSVLCEVGRSSFRAVDMEEAVASCKQTMATLGADLSALVSTWVRVVPMGYPVPMLGRDELLRRIDEELRAAGVYSRGRFGGWRYESCNQDYSFQQGVQAVDSVLQGAPEDVYWHPERF
jgi:protoporphyrinogen oxidase